jgi:hypothetical protein
MLFFTENEEKQILRCAQDDTRGRVGHGNSLMGNEAGMLHKTQGLVKCDARANDFGWCGISI